MTQATFIAWMTWVILAYFIALNLGYLVLNLLSLARLHRMSTAIDHTCSH